MVDSTWTVVNAVFAHSDVPVEALPLQFCAHRLNEAGLRALGWDAVMYVQELAS